MFDAFQPLRLIATRMTLGLLALGLVAMGGASATYLAMDAQASRVQALTRAADGPQLIESLRAEVYATVMESRGLYIAHDKAQANGFASNLLGHLAQVESNWRKLHDVLPASGQAKSNSLESAMSGFVALRTELARVGVADGAEAASKFGNNDPNRSAREALSLGIDELAAITTKTVDDLEAETIASGRRIALILLAVTTTAVVTTLGVILWLLRRSVSLPLRRLANALGEVLSWLAPGWSDLSGQGLHTIWLPVEDRAGAVHGM